MAHSTYRAIPTDRALVPGTRMALRTALEGLESARRVVVVRRLHPVSVEEPDSGFHAVGTLATLDGVHRSDTGGVIVDVSGELLVRIEETLETDSGMEVRVLPVDVEEPAGSPGLVVDVESALRRYMAVRIEAGESGDVAVSLSRDAVAASHEVASHLKITWPELQELLEAGSAEDRLRRAAMVLERETGLLRHLLERGRT